MTTSSTWAKRAVVGLVVCVMTLLIASFLVLALLKTSWGEERARNLVSDIVNEQINGKMRVERLENIEVLSPPGVIRADATTVRFFTPDDVEVIKVDKATVEFNAADLLNDEVTFNWAEVDGGIVTVEMDSAGVLRIEAAFTDPEAPFEPLPFNIGLMGMRTKNMQLVLRPSPDQTLWFDHLKGTVDVIRDGQKPGVIVKFRDFEGSLDKPRPLGIKASVYSVNGEIDGEAKKVADFTYAAKIGKLGKVTGRFRLYPDDKKPAKLGVKGGNFLTKVATFGADIGTAFGGQIDVQVLD